MKRLPPKQKRVLRYLLSHDADKRLLFLVGSSGSGKSLIAGLAFLVFADQFEDCDFILAGKVESSVVRNILPPLRDAATMLGVDYKSVKDGYRFGANTFYRFGANDEKSQDKIQGMNAAGALLDEVVLMPRSFVDQTLLRVRLPGAKAVFTMNPQGPNHWMKTDFIDRAGEMSAQVVNFTLDDNPYLDAVARASYERSFTGVFYERNVLGKWSAATGLVWPRFEKQESPAGVPEELDVTVDWGAASVTAALAIGRFGSDWYVLSEYYWDAEQQGHRAASEHVEAVLGMVAPLGVMPKAYIVDPSAVELRRAFERAVKRPTRVVKADNQVIPGIQNAAVVLDDGRLKVSPGCEMLIRELGSYRWDENAAARGEDKPVKREDHACDALRYFARRRFGRKTGLKARAKPSGL